MIAIHMDCPACDGVGGRWAAIGWTRCSACDGIGRAWGPRAPAYGCVETIADRTAGEIVTLGTGDRVKIAWHQPRKTKKIRPETTFVLMIDEFTDRENAKPISLPSCIGVASVEVSRQISDDSAHDRERSADIDDPMQRTAGRLI